MLGIARNMPHRIGADNRPVFSKPLIEPIAVSELFMNPTGTRQPSIGHFMLLIARPGGMHGVIGFSLLYQLRDLGYAIQNMKSLLCIQHFRFRTNERDEDRKEWHGTAFVKAGS